MTLNLKRLAIVSLVFAVMLTIVASVTALPSGEQPASPAAPAATARLAVAHLAPFAPVAQTAVTVTLNNTPVLTNVLYGQSTAYLTVSDGNNSVAIYAGSSSTPAISRTINLISGTDYSAIAIGDVTNRPLTLTLLTDDNTAPASGFAKLRLGHLAPFANTITGTLADVRLQDGTPLITNVTFSQVASYLTLAAGTYDLKITAPGGYPTLIDPMPVALPTGAIVSAFATGNGGNAKLGAFAWPSNAVGSFLPLGAQLQVAHLAPFANTIAGTSVTVTLNSTPVLTDFVYGESTAYLPVQEGTYTVTVLPGASLTPAITGTVILTQAQSFTAIAIGDASNRPLGLLALLDDTTPVSGSAKVRIGHLAPFANTITGTLADVRLQNGTLLLGNVPFGAVAPYLTLAAGTYDLKITAPGGYPTLIDPMPVTLNSNSILSVFAAGDGVKQKLGAFAWPSNAVGSFLPLGAQLQVAHLAPFANTIAGTSVTVTLNSTPVLTDFVYGESTAYLPVQEGTYTVTVLPGGSTTPAITGTVSLSQAQSYTAIAIGDVINQPLGLSALLDDTTPPPAGFAKLRLGHLAPFSNTLPGTAADVRLWNGTPIITNVLFSQVGTYLTLPAGVYPLQITAPGGSPTLIKPLPVTLVSGANLSAFAVGDGVKQPLGVFALPSGQPGFFLPLLKATIYLPIIAKN